MPRFLLMLTAFALAACATTGSRSTIAKRFEDFGLSSARANCLAAELDEDLDRSEMADVANFIGGLNEATSAGQALDALLDIDNPQIATAIAGASIACAFERS